MGEAIQHSLRHGCDDGRDGDRHYVGRALRITASQGGYDTDAYDPPFVAVWGKSPPYPADLDAVLAILLSGRQLTFTAEGAKYQLPGADKKVAASYRNEC